MVEWRSYTAYVGGSSPSRPTNYMDNRSKKPTLLMADDEVFMHDFARDALGKEWRVVSCKTVGEVVDVVNKLGSRERVSVALLDYLLPGGESELWG